MAYVKGLRCEPSVIFDKLKLHTHALTYGSVRSDTELALSWLHL
jgi:hypothetical protein